MTMQRSVLLLLTVLALIGCDSMRKVMGLSQVGEPSELKSAEARWLLIQNPRYGDVASEPEYIWVEEDKVPLTFKTLINKSSVYAPPEVVAKYGPPPGGGKISSAQGVPYQPAASPRPTAAGPVTTPAPAATLGGRVGRSAACATGPRRRRSPSGATSSTSTPRASPSISRPPTACARAPW